MTTLGLSKIGQIAVTAHDLERATTFYRDVLGMKFLFQTETMSFFDCDGVMLMLGIPTSDEFDHRSSILYFQVDDIIATHEKLVSGGVVFQQDPHFVASMGENDLWLAFFDDTERNVMALRSFRPKA